MGLLAGLLMGLLMGLQLGLTDWFKRGSMNCAIVFRVVQSAHLHCETQGCSGVACGVAHGVAHGVAKIVYSTMSK